MDAGWKPQKKLVVCGYNPRVCQSRPAIPHPNGSSSRKATQNPITRNIPQCQHWSTIVRGWVSLIISEEPQHGNEESGVHWPVLWTWWVAVPYLLKAAARPDPPNWTPRKENRSMEGRKSEEKKSRKEKKMRGRNKRRGGKWGNLKRRKWPQEVRCCRCWGVAYGGNTWPRGRAAWRWTLRHSRPCKWIVGESVSVEIIGISYYHSGNLFIGA